MPVKSPNQQSKHWMNLKALSSTREITHWPYPFLLQCRTPETVLLHFCQLSDVSILLTLLTYYLLVLYIITSIKAGIKVIYRQTEREDSKTRQLYVYLPKAERYNTTDRHKCINKIRQIDGYTNHVSSDWCLRRCNTQSTAENADHVSQPRSMPQQHSTTTVQH